MMSTHKMSHDNFRIVCISILQHFFTWLPDKIYIKLMFRLRMRHKLNLRNPKTFCEKIQWLKLYDRQPEYTILVDKYSVKQYVSSIIGEEFIIPTLGVWDNPETIDWEKLPNQFVLKTTHGGGSSGVVICKDKGSFDKSAAISKLRSSLMQDVYKELKEWPYKTIPRRIIAEQFILPPTNSTDLPDYKWYCFNGEPSFCQVIQERSSFETIDFFNLQWEHQDFIGLSPTAVHASKLPDKPNNLDLQISIARKLSKGLSFCRIDLYEVENRVYFGEVTLYPRSGFGLFIPIKYDRILGEMLNIQINHQ